MTRPSTLHHILRNMKYTREMNPQWILPIPSWWVAKPRRNPFDHWCHVGYMDTPHYECEKNSYVSHINETKISSQIITYKEKVE